MIIEWNAYPDNGALGYGLNNVFDWTANSLGDKEKEVSDVGSSAEVIEVARKEQKEVSDFSTSEDSACIQSEITLTETGEGISNAVLTASNITEDSGQFVETLGVTGNLLVTDSGSYLEEVAATSLVQISDNVQSLDSLEINVTALLIDSGSFADLTLVSKEFSVPDSGNFTDTVELTSQVTGIDSGNFTDIVGTELYASLEDFGGLSENVWSEGEIGIVDSATGLTVIPYIELPVLDSVSSDEFLVMEGSLTFTDQALSEDAIDMSAVIQIIESGTSVDESVSLSITCPVTDSGQLIDTVSISGEGQIEISDVGSFVEDTETESSILWEDSCNSNEIIQLDTQCTISDTASFSEYVGMYATLAVTDISTSVDFSEIQSSLLALDSVNSSDETLIEAQTTVSDTVSSSDFGLLEVHLTATDQILSETSIVTSTTCTVSDIGQSIDTVSMTANVQLSESMFLAEETIELSVTYPVTDTGQFSETTEILSDTKISDTGSFEDNLGSGSTLGKGKLGAFILAFTFMVSQSVEDLGSADDVIELTASHLTADTAQLTETIEMTGKTKVTDLGSFISVIGTEANALWEDTCSALDSVEIVGHIGYIDSVDTSESIINVCFNETTDYSNSEDSAYTWKLIILTETVENLSVTSVSVFGTTEDSGQFVETSTITGSLSALDESVGHTVVQWVLGHYHKVDKSMVVSLVNRTTKVKFKRRRVRER